MFCEKMSLADPFRLPVDILRIKFGMSIAIDIPNFIRKISTGNLKGSARDIFSQNIMGGMCARVCPTETLCEGACVRETQDHQPVRIGELQRYATDSYLETSETFFERAESSGKKIAVVGGGPAGLSCASSGHKWSCPR